jgi:hypothetical protein
LKWWAALTPRSWHVGPRVWADRDKAEQRIAYPQVTGEAEDALGELWSVMWRPGPGLSDSLVLRRAVYVDPSSAEPNERRRADLNLALDFGVEPRVSSPLPSSLVGRGIPACTSFSNETLGAWSEVVLPSWAVILGAEPDSDDRLNLTDSEPDGDALQRAAWSAIGETVEEHRAYGWPLRSMHVRGWRRRLDWFGDEGSSQRFTDEWASDGLGEMPPLGFYDASRNRPSVEAAVAAVSRELTDPRRAAHACGLRRVTRRALGLCEVPRPMRHVPNVRLPAQGPRARRRVPRVRGGVNRCLSARNLLRNLLALARPGGVNPPRPAAGPSIATRVPGSVSSTGHCNASLMVLAGVLKPTSAPSLDQLGKQTADAIPAQSKPITCIPDHASTRAACILCWYGMCATVETVCG